MVVGIVTHVITLRACESTSYTDPMDLPIPVSICPKHFIRSESDLTSEKNAIVKLLTKA